MELANILELIHAVSDSDLTEFNLQDDTLNISMSKEKTIVQQMAVNTDPADAQQYQPVVQQAVHVESVNAVNDEVQTGSVVKSPLVGTYYAASSPENPPFVKVGDKVRSRIRFMRRFSNLPIIRRHVLKVPDVTQTRRPV